jgi:hypothetical protein
MSRYPNPFYDQFAADLNLQLKPPEADNKISPNLIYEVSIYYKVVCLWCTKSSVSAAELNLKLKSQENNIGISPNFKYDLTPSRLNMKFQLILRWFSYGSLKIVFLQQKLNDPSNFN